MRARRVRSSNQKYSSRIQYKVWNGFKWQVTQFVLGFYGWFEFQHVVGNDVEAEYSEVAFPRFDSRE